TLRTSGSFTHYLVFKDPLSALTCYEQTLIIPTQSSMSTSPRVFIKSFLISNHSRPSIAPRNYYSALGETTPDRSGFEDCCHNRSPPETAAPANNSLAFTNYRTRSKYSRRSNAPRPKTVRADGQSPVDRPDIHRFEV